VTSEDVRSELEKQPFAAFRLHLVSGKTIDVATAAAAWMLQNAVLVFQAPQAHGRYDIVSLRNVERLEQLPDDGGSTP
jgi:ABC-type arginine transport system ATPase subunit